MIGDGNTASLEPEEQAFQVQGRLRDKFGRSITDLRVSVTDRCNYKCVYCRTGNEGAQYTELSIEDYLRMVRVFVSLGVEKVRLTGGEPLLRQVWSACFVNWLRCERRLCQMEASLGATAHRWISR